MSDKTLVINDDAVEVIARKVLEFNEAGLHDSLEQAGNKAVEAATEIAKAMIAENHELNKKEIAELLSTEQPEQKSDTPFLDLVRYSYAKQTGNDRILEDLKQKDHIVGTAAQGGYMAPTVPDNELVNLTIRDSIMLSLCRNVPVMTNVMTMPTLTQTGGLNGYWVAESTDADGGSTKTTEETLVLGQLTITMYALRAFSVVSNEALEDTANFGTAIEDLIRMDLSEAFAAAVDFGVLHGTAAAGEANVASLLTGLETQITTNVFNAGGAPGYSDIVKLMTPEDNSRGPIELVMAPAARRALIDAKDNDGRPIWETGFQTGNIPNALGMPVHLNRNVLKNLGSGAETAIFSGSFSRDALIGTKSGIRILVNPYRFANHAATEITAFARFGFTVTAENRFAILGGVTV